MQTIRHAPPAAASAVAALRKAVQPIGLEGLEGRRLLSTTYTLDFEADGQGNPLAAGTVVAEQWANLGVHITTDQDLSIHPAMIFDSAHPTGDDVDLGTPNESFEIADEVYGPGKGWQGGWGQPGANDRQLRNVLIVEHDNVMENTEGPDGPNDWDLGGSLIITFDRPVQVHSLDVLDIDTIEGYDVDGDDHPQAVSTVEAHDADGNLVAIRVLAGYGDNTLQVVDFGDDATGVSKLVIAFRGIDPANGRVSASGAIDNLRFTIPDEPTAALGDKVWYDCDGDGKQDPGEPGVAGVKVELFGAGPDGLANTDDDVVTGLTDITDASGIYGFSDLAPGKYFVKFTAPSGYAFTTANAGVDDAIDSDAAAADGTTHVTELSAGETDLTLDAGLVKQKKVCTPPPPSPCKPWWEHVKDVTCDKDDDKPSRDCDRKDDRDDKRDRDRDRDRDRCDKDEKHGKRDKDDERDKCEKDDKREKDKGRDCDEDKKPAKCEKDDRHDKKDDRGKDDKGGKDKGGKRC